MDTESEIDRERVSWRKRECATEREREIVGE